MFPETASPLRQRNLPPGLCFYESVICEA